MVRTLSAGMLLIFLAFGAHTAFADADDDLFEEVDRRFTNNTATMQDAQLALERGFELYRARRFGKAQVMLIVGNGIYKALRGADNLDAYVFITLAKEQEKLADAAAATRWSIFRERARETGGKRSLNETIRTELGLQSALRSRLEGDWLDGIRDIRDYTSRYGDRLNETTRREARVTCGLLVDRYATLPQTERSLNDPPQVLKARWCR